MNVFLIIAGVLIGCFLTVKVQVIIAVVAVVCYVLRRYFPASHPTVQLIYLNMFYFFGLGMLVGNAIYQLVHLDYGFLDSLFRNLNNINWDFKWLIR